ncbi:MAG: nitrilase-related carbon-nitrogen hydrolase [Chloroflexota bacterium]
MRLAFDGLCDWVNYRNQAETLNSGMFNNLSEMAGQGKISILGSIFEKRGDKVANGAAFYAANGRLMGVYRKIHLFRLFDEDRYLQEGGSALTMDLPWGPTSVAICYDLRFPELFRRYADEGSKLILLVAEWPTVRIEHWRTLIQARAIENQVFVAAVNSTGTTGDKEFGGHSMIVDPFGKIIVEAGDEPFLVTGEIDLDRVDEARRAMPVMKDRRPELYNS